MDVVGLAGVEGVDQWTQAGVVRYRSRRDLLAIGLDPAFAGEHVFKVAALEKTIAYPVEPQLYLGDLRLLLLLVMLVVLLAIDNVLRVGRGSTRKEPLNLTADQP